MMHRPENIDNLETERSVSLDALQLLIVLTVGIARDSGDKLMVPMYIPTRSELTSIDLQDVMFPSITDTISTYWERLYVTAGLQTHDAEQVPVSVSTESA